MVLENQEDATLLSKETQTTIEAKKTDFLFDKIISSISLDEIPSERTKVTTDKETIQKSIALFGRLIANGHVNWPYFPDSYKMKFKKGIIDLYNTPPQTTAEMLKCMETLLLKSIPDNHTFLLNNQNQRLINSETAHAVEDAVIDKYPKTSVGQNACFSLPNQENTQTLCLQQNDKGHSIGIFTQIVNGKKLGIIALSKCPQPNDPNFDFKAFLNVLDENLQHFDGVVFDARGNEGGNALIIAEINKRLYGNDPQFLKARHMRTTDEAKHIHMLKYPGYEKTLNRIYQTANENGYCTLQSMENTNFNPEKGYNKPIYVLADRMTCSSGEYIFALHNHPKAKFMGENSCGCGEYGDTTGIPLPAGGLLVTGCYINEMTTSIPEGIGKEPTHPTPKGMDALSHAMAEFKKDLSPYVRPFSNTGR